MATVFLVLVVVLVVAGLVFGVVSLLSGDDPGMSVHDPDGRARPLPNNRSLSEFDLKDVRFDTGLRGYRMSQVDRVLRRTAYDLGYKDEMIAVLEAEVAALREGRKEDAELLRKARESAVGPSTSGPVATEDQAPASSEPLDDSVEDFSRSPASAGTAETPEVDPEADAMVAPAAEDQPREGSLRRRRLPPEPERGENLDGAEAAAADSDADTAPVDRPAKHG